VRARFSFTTHRFKGIARGPGAVHSRLRGLLAEDVTLEADGVRLLEDAQVRVCV
jgi:hypothetical protein